MAPLARAAAFLLAALVIAGSAGNARGEAEAAAPRFARIFGEHAVLQRDRPIALWGRAAPGASVRLTLGDAAATARADRQGRWHATLPPQPAGGPYVLTASAGGGSVALRDVVVGDVYLCGGQSNMEFPARLATGSWSGLGSPADPNLRFATIPKASEPAPLDDLPDPVAWKVAGPDTVGEASAACYFMARSLRRSEHVPVGFVASDWGGTTIQGWIGAGALATMPGYAAGVARVARLASDPAGARADEERRQEAWWDAHDPAAAAQRAWIAPDFDDSAWPTMTPAGSWKDAGVPALAGFDGVVWLRRQVVLTAAQAAAAQAGARLQLGPVDTFDTAWVNGRRVGGGGTAWVWRDYALPAGTLHAGANTIVLRVLGGGGLTGDPAARGIRMAAGDLIPLAGGWRYRAGLRATGLSVPAAPWDVPASLSTLYNGMIAPIAGYGWKLVAWYQGEANTGAAAEYATLLPMLMADWRRAAGRRDLPFLVVQLAGYGTPRDTPGESGWAALRDVQARVARADGHAGLVVTVDVGDRFDIHPSQKVVVGERLAHAARVVAYGRAGAAGGPTAASVTRRGDDLAVRFRDTGAGLHAYGAGFATGFEACTAVRCRFVAGEVSGDTVLLRGAGVPHEAGLPRGAGADGIVRVRYAWADAPVVNLFGGDDLPAVPFERAVDDAAGPAAPPDAGNGGR